MVSAAPEVPAAIVLNGNEQPSHSNDNGTTSSYTNGNGNGNGASASPSPSPATAGLGIEGNNGFNSHSASRRASNQR